MNPWLFLALCCFAVLFLVGLLVSLWRWCVTITTEPAARGARVGDLNFYVFETSNPEAQDVRQS